MKCYDEKQPLYLGTDASGVGPGAGLLQGREGVSCPRNPTPVNTLLRPIAFVNQSQLTTETQYNMEREALSILHNLQKFTTTALPKRYRQLQATSHWYPLKTGSNLIKEAAVHPMEYTPVQNTLHL